MMPTKKIVMLSLFLALAIIINVVENIYFNFIFIPGIKFGLANIFPLVVLCLYGYKDMVVINILRVFIASLISGTLFGMPFTISLVGVVGSIIILYPFYKINKLSIYGISMIQAVLFNIFQILIVIVLYKTNAFLVYIPYLVLTGVITGYLVAFIARYLIKALNNII